MTDDHLAVAELVQQRAQAQAQGLDPKKVDLGTEQPARVVLAKAGGLHQGLVLVVEGVGDEVGARGGEHGDLQRRQWTLSAER